MLNKPFDPSTQTARRLPPIYSWPASVHQFDDDSIWAVNAALGAGRPLLVRGEPGIGKSQLARAVADVLGVPFLYHVIDARCECDDLLYLRRGFAAGAGAVAGRSPGSRRLEGRTRREQVHPARAALVGLQLGIGPSSGGPLLPPLRGAASAEELETGGRLRGADRRD